MKVSKRDPRAITVTVNPALDLSIEVDRLQANEKNYALSSDWNPGGNGINAARIMNRLGVPALATGFAGGPTGERLAELLDAEKVPHRMIPIHEPTRINVTISRRTGREQTRISLPGPRVRAQEWQRLRNEILSHPQAKIVLFGGSLTDGVSKNELGSFLRTLEQGGIPYAIDFPGPVMNGLLRRRPFFIKPNLGEFQIMMKTRAQTPAAIVSIVRRRLSHIPLVCVSSVDGGALLISKDAVWFGRLPRLRLRSTVGAGDSMVAGIFSRLLKYSDSAGRLEERAAELAPELLRWGLACAGATLMNPGTDLGKKAEIHALLPRIRISRWRE